jgi:hypothetical protein
LPFLVLLCAPLVELVLHRPHTSTGTRRIGPALLILTIVFGVVVAVSVVNALAGVSVNALTYRLNTLNRAENVDWDTIFVPALSPLIGHWETLKPTNLDAAWIRATPELVEIDWLVVALTAAFISWCIWLLVRLLRGGSVQRLWLWGAMLGALVLSLLSLARYADDPRLGGNGGYAALLQTLARAEQPRDVLVLNDDAHARYWFNMNRARLTWYGLSRDPARWDAATQAMIAARVRQAPRVWFAYDDAVEAPNPMRAWLDANLEAIERQDFGDGVHLVLYRGGAP